MLYVIGKMPFFGKINPPAAIGSKEPLAGLSGLFSVFLKIIFIVAGLYVFLQIILGGIRILSSGGDPKALAEGRNKILWSLVGLLIVLSAWGIILLIQEMLGLCFGFACELELTTP